VFILSTPPSYLRSSLPRTFPALLRSLPSFLSLPSFPFLRGSTLLSQLAEPGRQTIWVHSDMKNKRLTSGDSGIEEVYRRRSSITSHKVHQNFGGVGQPQHEFLGYPDTRYTHSGCVTVSNLPRLE